MSLSDYLASIRQAIERLDIYGFADSIESHTVFNIESQNSKTCPERLAILKNKRRTSRLKFFGFLTLSQDVSLFKIFKFDAADAVKLEIRQFRSQIARGFMHIWC